MNHPVSPLIFLGIVLVAWAFLDSPERKPVQVVPDAVIPPSPEPEKPITPRVPPQPEPAAPEFVEHIPDPSPQPTEIKDQPSPDLPPRKKTRKLFGRFRRC